MRAHDLPAAALHAEVLERSGDPRAAVVRAHLRVAAFDADGAIETLTDELATAPSAVGWHCLGTLLLDHGRADEAREAFERAEGCDDVPLSVLRLEHARLELAHQNVEAAFTLLRGVTGLPTAALRDEAENLVHVCHRMARGQRLVPAVHWRVQLDAGPLVVEVEGLAVTPEALAGYAADLGLPAGLPILTSERVRVDPEGFAGVTRLGRVDRVNR
jgi:hypothetical protein